MTNKQELSQNTMSSRSIGERDSQRWFEDQPERVQAFMKERNLHLLTHDEAILTKQAAMRQLLDDGLEKNGFGLKTKEYDKSEH